MEEPRFKPGDRVLLRHNVDEGEEERVEKGIVVWTWLNDQDVYDCYVAFFGEEWPGGDEKPTKPYVLRYYDASLEPAPRA